MEIDRELAIPEFRSFSKILHITKLRMSITQKIHGSNAQILIYKDENDQLQIKAGSRSRWLTESDDNYGFCKFIMANSQEFIDALGEGRHFGEWAGKGINSGEGLEEKRLVLFNWRRWMHEKLPTNTTVVPVLYDGILSIDAINDAMDKLKEKGSHLVPGFNKPEGIVIEIDGNFYKNVFDAEEVQWKQTTKRIKEPSNVMDISYLLQPVRLEKLLSKDEKYLREYPESLSKICSDYVKDLEEEKQFKATDEDGLKREKKNLGRSIFFFVKSIVASMRNL